MGGHYGSRHLLGISSAHHLDSALVSRGTEARTCLPSGDAIHPAGVSDPADCPGVSAGSAMAADRRVERLEAIAGLGCGFSGSFFGGAVAVREFPDVTACTQLVLRHDLLRLSCQSELALCAIPVPAGRTGFRVLAGDGAGLCDCRSLDPGGIRGRRPHAADSKMRMKLLTALLCAAPLAAHVGSPDVFYEGEAGPYRLLVTIRPPQVIPGVAQVEIRSTSPEV